jgi:hypothetical protein
MKNFLLLALLTTPAQAQYYPTYQSFCVDWTCYQQRSPQKLTQEPRHRSRHVEKKHTEKPKVYHSEPKPTIRTVTVYKQARTWQNMNQDDAREWIKDQAQSFCGRYPKDEACQKKE